MGDSMFAGWGRRGGGGEEEGEGEEAWLISCWY